MKKKLLFAGMIVAAGLAVPAQAFEHEVVIEHAAGTIAADYKGAIRVETKQVGTAGVAGRPNTLRCNWTASINVVRNAKVGETLQSRRLLTRDDVASGSTPGWCATNAKAVDRMVDRRQDAFRTAMFALVEQDRSEILAEAESARTNNREG